MAVLIYLLITLSQKLCIWAKGTTKTLLKCHCLFQEVRRSCIVSWWRHFLLTWKTLRVFILAVDKNFYLFRFWHRLSKSPSSDFLWPLTTLSLAVGCFSAKDGTLRSPRGQLVASLVLAVLQYFYIIRTTLEFKACNVYYVLCILQG